MVKIKYLCGKCQYVEYIGSFNRIYYIIDRNEIEEVIESFGLKKEEDYDFLYGIYNKWTILMYDKGNRKVCVCSIDDTGFGDYIKDKETFEAKLGDFFKAFKENEIKKKIEIMKGDFE